MGSLARELARKELRRTYKTHKASYMVMRRYHELLKSQGNEPQESYANKPYPHFKNWIGLYGPWLEKQKKQTKEQFQQLEMPQPTAEDFLRWEEETVENTNKKEE